MKHFKRFNSEAEYNLAILTSSVISPFIGRWEESGNAKFGYLPKNIVYWKNNRPWKNEMVWKDN